jgi:hypothetical protein
MKIYDALPNSVMVNGRKIRVNLAWQNVLKMLDVLSDEQLLPEAREYRAMKCICKHPKDGMCSAVLELLGFGNDKQDKQRITDLDQDADMIRAAFMQTYCINLYRDKLHWFEFTAFLSCIPEGSKYAEVLSIRARPIPEANKYNAKEREWLIRAKAEYALKLSEKEREKQYSENVKNIGAFLMALAGDGGK